MAEYSDGEHNGLSTADIDEHIFYGLYTVPAFEPTMVTYDELRNTGRLGLISDIELREKLQAFSKEIKALDREEAGLVKMSYEISDPFLLKNVDWRGFTAIDSLAGWEPPILVEPLKNRRDFKVTLRQPEFQNIVLYRSRMNMSYLNSANVLSTSLDELQILIDQRLSELGEK